ncbi:monocarboxylate transporter 12 [Trichonephila clavipes]|nr:monocarboxylate transporter 12 [Trichonephila clavipes]
MSPNKEEAHATLSVSPTKEKGPPIEEEEEEEEVELMMPEPPDGGWGWVVVFFSFMIHVIVDGVTYTFGIFYLEFLRYFKQSKGATSWVSSIMVGTTFCVVPLWRWGTLNSRRAVSPIVRLVKGEEKDETFELPLNQGCSTSKLGWNRAKSYCHLYGAQGYG